MYREGANHLVFISNRQGNNKEKNSFCQEFPALPLHWRLILQVKYITTHERRFGNTLILICLHVSVEMFIFPAEIIRSKHQNVCLEDMTLGNRWCSQTDKLWLWFRSLSTIAYTLEHIGHIGQTTNNNTWTNIHFAVISLELIHIGQTRMDRNNEWVSSKQRLLLSSL